LLASGFEVIDKSDGNTPFVGVDGELSYTGQNDGNSLEDGTFSFTPVSGYSNYLIAFKSGEGQLDPGWAIFSLPGDVFSGAWAIDPQKASGLSHINLYVKKSSDSEAPRRGSQG